MPAAPKLFLGDSASGKVLELGAGVTDDGTGFVPLGKSARAAPAGVGGECIFTSLYFAVTHQILTDNQVLVRITPILDGVPQDGASSDSDERQIVTLLYDAGKRKTERFEIGLSVPNVYGLVTTIMAQDTFTGADGPLVGHVPDVPASGSYVVNASSPDTFFTINSNRARITPGGSAGIFAWNTVDVPAVIGDGEWRIRIEGTDVGTTSGVILLVRAKNIGGGPGVPVDFLAAQLRQTSATQADIRAVRYLNGGQVESPVIASIPFQDGDSLDLGMTLANNGDGTVDAEFWTEPFGGGARTIHGSHTFAADYADANHQRFGIGGSGLATYDVTEIQGSSFAPGVTGVDKGRVAMRGTWFQYLVEATQLDAGAGELTFEVAELEHEIVRESLAATETP